MGLAVFSPAKPLYLTFPLLSSRSTTVRHVLDESKALFADNPGPHAQLDILSPDAIGNPEEFRIHSATPAANVRVVDERRSAFFP